MSQSPSSKQDNNDSTTNNSSTLHESYEQYLKTDPFANDHHSSTNPLPLGSQLISGQERLSSFSLTGPPTHMGLSPESDAFLFAFIDTEFGKDDDVFMDFPTKPTTETTTTMTTTTPTENAGLPAAEASKRRRVTRDESEEDEDDDDLDDDGADSGVSSAAGKSTRKSSTSSGLVQTSTERRRFLNRNNAKKSRLRKKWKMEAVVLYAAQLQEENRTLKAALNSAGLEIPLRHEALAPRRRSSQQQRETSGSSDEDSLKGFVADTTSPKDWDFLSFVQLSRANFLLADPRKPDCPIVYVNSGFLSMSGYTKSEVLGRNCRFLQGPDTDREKVSEIAKAIKAGTHCSVTILNYRKDGTPFWNQLFVAPLGGSQEGDVSFFIGIQREVSVKKTPVT